MSFTPTASVLSPIDELCVYAKLSSHSCNFRCSGPARRHCPLERARRVRYGVLRPHSSCGRLQERTRMKILSKAVLTAFALAMVVGFGFGAFARTAGAPAGV